VPCGFLPVRLHRSLPVHTAVRSAGTRSGTGGERSASIVPAAAVTRLHQRTTGTRTRGSCVRGIAPRRAVPPGTLHRVDRATAGARAQAGVDTVPEVDILTGLRHNS